MAAFLRALCCRKNITGKDKTTSQPVVNRKTGTCSLCSCLEYFDRYRPNGGYTTEWSNGKISSAMIKAQSSLFHKQCAHCDDIPELLLCWFCKHLRLRHLAHTRMFANTDIHLMFGTGEDIQKRAEDCEFCCMIAQEGCLNQSDSEEIRYYSAVKLDFTHEYKDIDLTMEVITWARGQKVIRNFGVIFDTPQVDDGNPTRGKIWQQPMVDWITIRNWLSECDTDHGISTSKKHDKKHDKKHGMVACNNGPLKSPPRQFRVIDTERGCVVMAPPACRYATLSYVWGSTADKSALANESTIQAMEKDGYLFKMPLPATIRDSIHACIELKIRYLWIDRLCIVQDDTTGVKASQINAMGDIYSHSYLTLVALEGVSMDHGLPGVSQARAGRKIYRTHGMSLRVIDDNFWILAIMSQWGSRGWTFQEAILSPRMLFFADAGVYFECSQAAREDRFARSTLREPLFTPTWEYWYLVYHFTQRTLTFNADVLKAFSGIMHWLYGSEHYFGLPYCEFVGGMFWHPRLISAHRSPVARCTETGDMFPSWSWSSVTEPVTSLHFKDTHTTLLGVWGIPSSRTKEKVHLIRPHNQQMSRDEEDGWVRELGIALAWKEGCFPKPLPSMLNVSTTWNEYRALLRSGWASFDKLNEEALGLAYLQGEEDIEKIFSSSCMEHANQPGALLGHTQSLEARMIQWGDKRPDSLNNIPYVQVSLHGMCDGRVDVWINSNPAHWKFLDHDYSRDHDTKLNLLALSMSHMVDSQFGYQDRGKEGRWYDSEGSVLTSSYSSDIILSIDILIVETRDGLSRRVTTGFVELHDWISASPEFRNFTLV